MDEIDTVIKAYQLYQEQTTAQGLEPLLSVTRAWRLVKFVDNGMLTMTKCSQVRRPLRHPPARDRQPLRLRPVQAAGARRQGQGRAAASACTDRTALDSPSRGRSVERQGSSGPFSCLSPPAQPCALTGPSGPALFVAPAANSGQFERSARPVARTLKWSATCRYHADLRAVGTAGPWNHHHARHDRLRRRHRLHLRRLHPARRQHRRDPARAADRADDHLRRRARRLRRSTTSPRC